MPVNPQDDQPDELAGRVIASLTDLAGALGRLNDLIARQLGIAPTDLLCLHVLNRAGATTAGVLSSQLGRSTGALTHMIDRLEQAGYVRRQPDPGDRRRVLVEASAPGLERIAAFYEEIDARSRRLMATFSGDQLAAIRSFLQGSHEITADECDHLIRSAVPARPAAVPPAAGRRRARTDPGETRRPAARLPGSAGPD